MQNWKDICWTNGTYQVSDLGRYKRIYKSGKERIMTGHNSNGYLHASICINGKVVAQPKVHDLVIEAFDRPMNENEECHHKNHITTDNRLQNLQIIDIHTHRSEDEVTKQKQREANLGKVLSEETKQKISQAKKQYWQKKKYLLN